MTIPALPPGAGGAPHSPGATPLDPDELAGLRPKHIQTQGELNAWEARNILQAEAWIASWRRQRDVLTVKFLAELHRRMFGDTWRWAGKYRQTMKTVSPYQAYDVPALVRDLVDDVRAQRAASPGGAEDLDDIALRYHHRLVRIHPWPNGNGRHSRLAADLALVAWGRPRFTWGHHQLLGRPGEERERYLAGLCAADGWDFAPLRAFVRR